MTTNEYIREVKNLDWKRFDGKLWQSNYWDDIIRSTNHWTELPNTFCTTQKDGRRIS